MSKRVLLSLFLLFSIFITTSASEVRLYKKVGEGADAYWIYPFIKIENTSGSSIDLANYTVEYYFYCPDVSSEEEVDASLVSSIWYFGLNHGAHIPDVFTVDFSYLGKTYENGKRKANVKAVYHFNSINVPNGQYALAECGIRKASWGTFSKNYDWSYENQTELTETQFMVVRNSAGEVVWGLDPTTPLNKVTLYTRVNGYGKILLDPAGGVYDIGDEVTVTAIPDEGYKFEKWVAVETPPANTRGGDTVSVTLTLTNDLFLGAFFVDKYDDTPDQSSYAGWNLLSGSSSKIDGSLLLSNDLHLGASGIGNKFVLHSRNHDNVGDKGDFLEIAYENRHIEGDFSWGTGLVLKPSLNKDDCNIGIGTTNPREKLDVRGNIATNGGDLILRSNLSAHDRCLGLSLWRYNEGISTGRPTTKVDPHKYGLNFNSLIWNDGKTKYQDPITFHAGSYNFYTFNDGNDPYKEVKAFTIENNGSLRVGSNSSKNTIIDSSSLTIVHDGAFGHDRTISVSASSALIKMNDYKKLENRYLDIAPREIKQFKSNTTDDDKEGLESRVTPGSIRLTREWGNWLELRAFETNSAWFFHNPAGRKILEFGFDDNISDEIDPQWQILNIHGSGAVSIGKRDVDVTDQKLVVAGNTTVDGTVKANKFQVGEWVITDAPDFVFKEDYDLKPLSEVEKFIKKKSHLPGVPSAEEIKTEGFDLVKMNMLLLQKVEELTLHSIEQNKVSVEQNSLIANQQKRIDALEKKIEDMQ